MKHYDDKATCEKCGGSKIREHFYAKEAQQFGDRAERHGSSFSKRDSIERTCERCHFQWEELPIAPQPAPTHARSEWWCPTCNRSPRPVEVTFEEHHEECGTYIGNTTRPAPAAGDDEVERVARELYEAHNKSFAWHLPPWPCVTGSHRDAWLATARYALSLRPSASNATIEEFAAFLDDQADGLDREYSDPCAIDHVKDSLRTEAKRLRSLFVASNASGGS